MTIALAYELTCAHARVLSVLYLLLQRDANVFLVDWNKGANLLNYLQVASNTRVVGAAVSR